MLRLPVRPESQWQLVRLSARHLSSSECVPSAIAVPLLEGATAAAAGSSLQGEALLATASALAPNDVTSISLQACSTLEEVGLSPVQLGVQLWEWQHSLSGLPWWASIPATTVALRLATLPLSLKARAASSNFSLLNDAIRQARELTAGMPPAQVQALGRWELIRHVFSHMREQSGATSFRWYVANAAVQLPLLLLMTLALRYMSANLWPGLASEGLPVITDLTAPPVHLKTLSTPYGTAGAVLPLGLLLLVTGNVDKAAAGSVLGLNAALQVASIPLYCTALIQPHAVLLYWLSWFGAQRAILLAGSRPAAAKLAGVSVPDVPVQASSSGSSPQHHHEQQHTQPEAAAAAATEALQPREQQQRHVLEAVAASYLRRGKRAAAAVCLERLLELQPGNLRASERLKELQQQGGPAAG